MFEHMLNMLNRDSFLKEILELGKKIWNIEVTHSWTCRQVEVTDKIFSFSLADMAMKPIDSLRSYRFRLAVCKSE